MSPVARRGGELQCGLCSVELPDGTPFFDVAISISSSERAGVILNVHESQGVFLACLSCARKLNWVKDDQSLNPSDWHQLVKLPIGNSEG